MIWGFLHAFNVRIYSKECNNWYVLIIALIIIISLISCSPYRYKNININHVIINKKLNNTDAIHVFNNYVLWSSTYYDCDFKIDTSKVNEQLKNSLNKLNITISFDNHGENILKGIFEQPPVKHFWKYYSTKSKMQCSEYIPSLKLEHINTQKIIEIADSISDNIFLIPVIVAEYHSIICNTLPTHRNFITERENRFCPRDIMPIGLRFNLGIFLIKNEQIIYFNSIDFYSTSQIDNYIPTQRQWNEAVYRVMENYMH